LLNKIAGLDRRDQVILGGRHIATLWFDVCRLTSWIRDCRRSLLQQRKRMVVC
jgi:predicted RNA-binding protein with PUA domain